MKGELRIASMLESTNQAGQQRQSNSSHAELRCANPRTSSEAPLLLHNSSFTSFQDKKKKKGKLTICVYELVFLVNTMQVSYFPEGRRSYLLSDFLLHLDRRAQLSNLFHSFAGKASIFPQHITLGVRCTDNGWPVIGTTWESHTTKKHFVSLTLTDCLANTSCFPEADGSWLSYQSGCQTFIMNTDFFQSKKKYPMLLHATYIVFQNALLS